jgi:hypothetical protein
MDKNFSDNKAFDMIRIIKEDKDPIHIYELLQTHFNNSIEDLKAEYEIKLDIIKSRVFIKGSEEKIYEVFEYFLSRGMKFESIETNQLRINLDHFFNKMSLIPNRNQYASE